MSRRWPLTSALWKDSEEMDTDKLPTFWNKKDKYNLLEVSEGNLRVAYTGPGKGDVDAAAIRANRPISPLCGMFYFEVTIVSKGRDGYIGIGLSTGNVNLNRLPGWEKNSYGYHGDDGNSFRGSGSGNPYGPVYTTGDVIGCCLNFVDNTIFYTKNGIHLGVAFWDVKGNLFPTVGLRTPGETLEVNFGTDPYKPFKFDFEGYRARTRDRVKAAIEDIAVPDLNASIVQLITSYLAHHSYVETLESLSKDMGESKIVPEAAMRERLRIRTLVLEGKIEDAIVLTNELFPEVLTETCDTMFQLKCQQFIEMITSQCPLRDTMEFGQNQLCKFEEEGNHAALREVFSLLAYSDASLSPVAHLLDANRRETVWEALNSAILTAAGYPKRPALEQLVRQANAVLGSMSDMGVGVSALCKVNDFL